MPDATVRANVYEPSYVLVYLTPEITLDLDVLIYVGADGACLPIGEVPNLCVRIHAHLAQDLLRGRVADPVHVGETNFNPLLTWQVHPRYACHPSPASACDGGLCRLHAPPRAVVSPCTARR